jgi:hypothetical protein
MERIPNKPLFKSRVNSTYGFPQITTEFIIYIFYKFSIMTMSSPKLSKIVNIFPNNETNLYKIKTKNTKYSSKNLKLK